MNAETSTAERILDVAQDLIQRRGYNAISFNDIAEGVGIKKPSIVHHFPSKSEIGRAVVERYRERFFQMLDQVVADTGKTSQDALDLFFTPYLDFGKTNDMICLCGALAGEFLALPEVMQQEVTRFFKLSADFLETTVIRGQDRKELSFEEEPRIVAENILGLLQGALLIKRATGRKAQVEEAVASVRGRLFV